jgi:hypothetical protein
MLGLVLLTSRPAATMDAELVVLQHEVAVLHRTNPKPARTGRTGPCFAASSGFEHHPIPGVRARADQPATMPTTRLIVVARMTVPKT